MSVPVVVLSLLLLRCSLLSGHVLCRKAFLLFVLSTTSKANLSSPPNDLHCRFFFKRVVVPYFGVCIVPLSLLQLVVILFCRI